MDVEADPVKSVAASFAGAWYRHDLVAFAGLFAEDAQFVNAVGLGWKGRPEVQGAHEFAHRALYRSSRVTVADVEVRFPAADITPTRCPSGMEPWPTSCSEKPGAGESSTRKAPSSSEASCRARSRRHLFAESSRSLQRSTFDTSRGGCHAEHL